MENATKALIIAGAILISILIISLGILVYNQASSTVDESNLDSETIQAYNSRFTMYAGSGQTAAEVNALINAVNSNNATLDSSSTTTTIEVDANGATGCYVDGSSSSNPYQYNYTFSNSYTYTVTTTTGTNGLVNKVTITREQ